ncbi:MAG: cyclase [Chloroflexota bacterium]
MPAMIVKHRVEDFNKWKAVFDEMEQARREYGWTGHELYRDVADPNKITIVNHMKDLNQARAYGRSEELRSAMAQAGVQGAPEIFLLNDDESKKY